MFGRLKYRKEFSYFATNMLLQLKGVLLCQNATNLCYLYLSWRHVSAFALGHVQVTRYIYNWGDYTVWYISVINQPDAQIFCFRISLFHASGIITPIRVMITEAV